MNEIDFETTFDSFNARMIFFILFLLLEAYNLMEKCCGFLVSKFDQKENNDEGTLT